MTTRTMTEATEQELTDAFDLWLANYDEDPDSFREYHETAPDGETYGEGCTRYLLKLLEEVR